MKKLSAQMSGTTVTVCIHETRGNAEDNGEKKNFGTITLAHVADSTAVLAKVSDKGYAGAAITRDHKPSLKDERPRIEKAGGRVVFDGYANHRVYAKNARYPGLNMSRCIGDLLGHQDCGISAEPEVSQRELTKDDAVLLLCSDGVWEFVNPQEAFEIVGGEKHTDAMKQAEKLAKESR